MLCKVLNFIEKKLNEDKFRKIFYWNFNVCARYLICNNKKKYLLKLRIEHVSIE